MRETERDREEFSFKYLYKFFPKTTEIWLGCNKQQQ